MSLESLLVDGILIAAWIAVSLAVIAASAMYLYSVVVYVGFRLPTPVRQVRERNSDGPDYREYYYGEKKLWGEGFLITLFGWLTMWGTIVVLFLLGVGLAGQHFGIQP